MAVIPCNRSQRRARRTWFRCRFWCGHTKSGQILRKVSELLLNHPVVSLRKRKTTDAWRLIVRRRIHQDRKKIDARFVFLGAGGWYSTAAKSGIPEAEGYGGFPVSGQWLVCKKPDIVKQHHAKVYGERPRWEPRRCRSLILTPGSSMANWPCCSVPTQVCTTKFLKKGSVFDLFASIKSDNMRPIMAVGWAIWI